MTRGVTRGVAGVALGVLAHLSFAQAQDDLGLICLAPLPKDVQEADRSAFSGGPRRQFKYAFTVEIDGHAPIAIPSGGPLAVEDVTLAGTHRVRIRDDGRLIESFRFKFAARGGTPLCLAYTPGYQTWSLERPRPGAGWCHCELSK